jgi:hypothetical protein
MNWKQIHLLTDDRGNVVHMVGLDQGGDIYYGTVSGLGSNPKIVWETIEEEFSMGAHRPR